MLLTKQPRTPEYPKQQVILNSGIEQFKTTVLRVKILSTLLENTILAKSP